MLESKLLTGTSKTKEYWVKLLLDVPVGSLLSSMVVLYHVIVNCKGSIAIFWDLQPPWPSSLTKPDLHTQIKVFFRACSLQNEVGDPPFFCISDITNSWSFNGKIFRKKSILEIFARTSLNAKFWNSKAEGVSLDALSSFSYRNPLVWERDFCNCMNWVHLNWLMITGLGLTLLGLGLEVCWLFWASPAELTTTFF